MYRQLIVAVDGYAAEMWEPDAGQYNHAVSSIKARIATNERAELLVMEHGHNWDTPCQCDAWENKAVPA